MAIGVFGLQVAYRLKRLEVMSTVNTHGWFGGGVTPTSSPVQVSRVDRIDFSNDTGTANIRGSLILAKTSLAATGNSNYGWFGGGNNASIPVFYTSVDRIDFSNDSIQASSRGPLTLERQFLAATGNSNYGWFGGGRAPSASPATVTRVERIDFSNDSATASPRGPLTRDRYGLSALGNSNYGWFGGGYTVTLPFFGLSTIDRIDFSNDATTASSRGLLNTNINGRQYLAATGNFNYGWFGGGVHNPSPTPVFVATVDRIDFSNDSASVLGRGSLSLVKGSLTATGNSNYGWFGGGYGPASAYYSTVERIDFANDSTSLSIRGPLSSTRYSSGATSGQAKGPAIKLQKAGNYGWFGGGFPGPSGLSTVDRIDFSNDLNTATTRGLLSAARYRLAATGNSNYGWFGGGGTGITNFFSTVDRIDFSNDSVSASPRGPLSQQRNGLAATGNSNYGWFAGGGIAPGSPTPTTVLTTDRIDFSNDSVSASRRATSILNPKTYLAATGNFNYGWFAGGATDLYPSVITSSIIERMDFSNDSRLTRGRLSAARYRLAATGNSNYGWFGGGDVSGGISAYSLVDRINFSNDSLSALVRGTLSAGRYSLAATGNSNYGWFGGGLGSIPGSSPFTAMSIVDRIDFSNDSVKASIRGSLNAPSGRYRLAATSNSTR